MLGDPLLQGVRGDPGTVDGFDTGGEGGASMTPKTKPEDKCVTPARGPITGGIEAGKGAVPASGQAGMRGGMEMRAQVGKPAPDFEASGYLNGGFKNFRLSDYKGKWVVLCFYPGDFTFV